MKKKLNKSSPKNGFDFRGGVRGKYAKSYVRGTNIVVLEPGVAKLFPDSKSVNEALRALGDIIKHQGKRVQFDENYSQRSGSCGAAGAAFSDGRREG